MSRRETARAASIPAMSECDDVAHAWAHVARVTTNSTAEDLTRKRCLLRRRAAKSTVGPRWVSLASTAATGQTTPLVPLSQSRTGVWSTGAVHARTEAPTLLAGYACL